MISLLDDRERRMELLKMAGGNLARAQELETWVVWGCSPEQMRSMAATAQQEGGDHEPGLSVDGQPHRDSATAAGDETVAPATPAEPDTAIPAFLRRSHA